MGKIRIILAAVFGLLSAFFAAVAARNALLERAAETAPARGAQKWGRSLEAAARADGKLVFFTCAKGISPKSESAKKALEKFYIRVELSPEKYPADYAALDSILSRAAKKNSTLAAGILSPSLHPIFLTSRGSSKNSDAAALDSAIIGAARQFYNNPRELKIAARDAVPPADDLTWEMSIPRFGGLPALFLAHTEAARLFALFGSRHNFEYPAALSENARLAFRIFAARPDMLAARSAAAEASRALCEELSPKRARGSAALLYLRALGESPFCAEEPLRGFYLEKAGALAQGAGETRRVPASVRDAALSAQVLLRAHAISGDLKFLKSAENLAAALAGALESREILPAQIGAQSEASSLEYALCARAFWEMSKFSKTRDWRALAKTAIEKWNAEFMTPAGLWSINSEKSALAKFSRPIITLDAAFPSYAGEAAQLFAEMGGRERQNAPLRNLAYGAASAAFPSDRRASLKLALFPAAN